MKGDDRNERRLQRERIARQEAELQAERGFRVLFQRQRMAELLRSVAETANQAEHLSDALEVALSEVSQYLKADAAHVWLVPENTAVLVSTGLWYLSDPKDPALRRLRSRTNTLSMMFGEGLPGQVAQRGEPMWVEDSATQDRGYIRNLADPSLQVRSWCGWPFAVGGQVVGLLEFFFAEPQALEDGVLQLAVSVGGQLGQMVERQRVNLALDRTREDLARQAEQLREREIELERQAEELRRQIAVSAAAADASRAKSEFMATMSHKVRAPLVAVLGFAELLMDEGVAEVERREHTRAVRRSGEQLLALLDNVLDVSKIEDSRVSFEVVEADLASLVDDATSLARSRAEERGVGLTVTASTPIPLTLQTDPERFRKVLQHLVCNAVQVTSQGGVRVDVSCPEPSSPHPRLVVAVTDDGFGLSAAELAGLFQPFSPGEHGHAGDALGLVIGKRILELMGGSLEVQSEEGAGSTFRASFPTGSLFGVPLIHPGPDALGKLASTRAPRPTAGDGLSVLIAEGLEDNVAMYRAMFARAGFRVSVVHDGHALLGAAANGVYDVIVTSLELGEFDALQAVMSLRGRGILTPVLGVSTRAIAMDRARCRAAGCDEVLLAPVERRRLVDAVRRLAAASVLHAQETLTPPIHVSADAVAAD